MLVIVCPFSSHSCLRDTEFQGKRAVKPLGLDAVNSQQHNADALHLHFAAAREHYSAMLDKAKLLARLRVSVQFCRNFGSDSNSPEAGMICDEPAVPSQAVGAGLKSVSVMRRSHVNDVDFRSAADADKVAMPFEYG